jgi:hypothetical protein
MKAVIFSGMVLLFAFPAVGTVQAQDESRHTTPLQISIWNPVQLAPDDWNVFGLRVNLPYGNNHDVSGVDIGVVNRLSGDFLGIQIGGYSFNHGPYSQTVGLQLAPGNSAWDMEGFQVGLFNDTLASCWGSQIGIINHCARSFAGVQFGLINERGVDDKTIRMMGAANEIMRQFVSSGLATSLTSGEFDGVQIGIYNGVYSSAMRGIQFGLHNYGSDVRGLQVGLLNRAAAMTGVQIGVVNIIAESPVPFVPIINAHF